MATIVNNPPQSNGSSGGVGIIIGFVVLVALGFTFFAYGLPAIQNMQLGAPQINIPSKIDVNVNQPEN